MAISLSDLTTNFGITTTTPNIWYFDGTTYTLRGNATTFDYLRDNAAVGDCLYFLVDSGATSIPSHQISLNVGTALVADAITGVWEYSCLLGVEAIPNTVNSFKALTVTDSSNLFRNTGAQTITWQVPNDWSIFLQATMFGTVAAARIVRFRITGVTNITEGGANATTIASRQSSIITLTGGYSSGTVTLSVGTYYLSDTSKSWTVNSLAGRHVWMTSGANIGKCFPIRSNTATQILFGPPITYNLNNAIQYTAPAAGIAVGDKYIVSYNVEDVRLADVAGSWNLVTDDSETRQINKGFSWVYKIRAQIYLSGSSGSECLFGGMNQCFYFYPGMKISVSSNIYAKQAYGMRAQRYDVAGNPIALSSNTTAYGVKMYFDNSSYEGSNPHINGWIYDTTFINGRSYSYVTALQINEADVRNVVTTGCQIAGTTNVTGYNLTQWGAEPLRNVASTFSLSGFKAGEGAALYTTTSGNYVLDGPSSTAKNSYLTWLAATSGTVTIIDQDPDTNKLVQWTTGATYTLKYYFKFRLYLKIQDIDGNPISGVAVTVTDVNGTVAFTDVTTATGSCTNDGTNMAIVEMHAANNTTFADVITAYNPFTVTISKVGYVTKVIKYTMDRKREEVETLEKQIPTYNIIDKDGVKQVINAYPTSPQNSILLDVIE